MVKLADIPEYERDHLLSKLLPPLGELPWVANSKPLSEKKIAIITTAGLNSVSYTHLTLPTTERV